MKIKKVLLGLTTLALGATFLAGCSSKFEDANNNLCEAVRNSINTSSLVQSMTNEEMSAFTFTGADFTQEKEGFYTVDIKGVGKMGGAKGYVSAIYEIEEDKLNSVSDKNDTVEVMNTLNQSIIDAEIKDFQFTSVQQLEKFNRSIFSAIECPIEDFNHDKGFVYSLKNLEFNEKEGYVSFQTKTDARYSKTTTTIVPVIMPNGDGGTKIVMMPKTTTDYEYFVQTTNFYVKATEQEIEAMKKDNSLVFNKIIEKIENKEKADYTVQSVEVLDKDSIFNTDVSGNKSFYDIEKDLGQ